MHSLLACSIEAALQQVLAAADTMPQFLREGHCEEAAHETTGTSPVSDPATAPVLGQPAHVHDDEDSDNGGEVVSGDGEPGGGDGVGGGGGVERGGPALQRCSEEEDGKPATALPLAVASERVEGPARAVSSKRQRERAVSRPKSNLPRSVSQPRGAGLGAWVGLGGPPHVSFFSAGLKPCFWVVDHVWRVRESLQGGGECLPS